MSGLRWSTWLALPLAILAGLWVWRRRGRARTARVEAPPPARTPPARQLRPGPAPTPSNPAPPRAGWGRRWAVGLAGLGALALGVAVGAEVVDARGGAAAASPTRVLPGADPERGREAIRRHGCGSCHVIPGVRTARGRVGPRLTDFAEQRYIAGVLVNEPANLVRWLLQPREVDPLTAMPDVGLTPEEARDVAAHLYQDGR